MGKIWFWNSMAKRRRSISDTFEENGLGIIESYLKQKGHEVRIIDWATSNGYNALSPLLSVKINKFIYKILFSLDKKNTISQKVLSEISLINQSILEQQQNNRMRNRLSRLAKEVGDQKLTMFGIKLWYGEAFGWAKYLAAQIKKFSPQTLIIVGGYHASLYEEDILKDNEFDLAIIGEGEYILNKLLFMTPKEWDKAKFLDQLVKRAERDKLPGIVYRNNGGIKKSSTRPHKNEKLIDENKAIPNYAKNNGKVKAHILLESVGCPWNQCNFCVHDKFCTSYEQRKIDNIIKEIKSMLAQEIGLFRFAGSDTPPNFARKIAEAILDNGLHVEYTMGSRAIRGSKNKKTYSRLVECYTIMLQSGLKSIFMGGETGNDVINEKVMNKGLKAEDLIYTIKAIREAEQKSGKKLNLTLALIYPTPLVDGVSTEDVFQDNLKLLRTAKPNSVMVTPPGPFKHTRWYEEKEKFGFELSPTSAL